MTNRLFNFWEIEHAEFCPAPSFASGTRRAKGRKGEGLRYEKRAQEQLCTQSEFYLPGPWLKYFVKGKPHWCQPDGINLDYQRGILTIIEIKLTHTADAARQLRGVYEPVLRKLFPEQLWQIALVEVTRWFDPDIAFPEPCPRISNPFDYEGKDIGVFIWRP